AKLSGEGENAPTPALAGYGAGGRSPPREYEGPPSRAAPRRRDAQVLRRRNGLPGGLRGALPEELQCRLRVPERPARGQDGEADPGEQEGEARDDPEEPELVRHVTGVQRGRERGLGHPDVAAAVVDRLLRRRVDHRVLRIASAAS